jgi:glycosyltransferase involved in cell wall biosynthesis
MPGRVAYNIASYWPLDADPHRVYWRNPSEHMLTRILLWPVGQLAVGILKATGYPPRPRFDHVSCCSQYVVDKLTDAGAIQPGAVAILNGIDPAPFLAHQRQRRAPHAPLHLLYFGSLIEHKGVHTAIEALGLMRQRGLSDGVDLTIVGGGQPDYEVKLRELTRSLTLEDRVRFVGRVPRSQIPQILSENDIYLFTSTWAEPFGRTIIEAMAAGLVVIGADVGGSREIFQHYPGNTLFEAGNAEALARQIERFVDDADLLDRLGEAGRRLVLERFTLDRMVDEMESWLKEIEA